VHFSSWLQQARLFHDLLSEAARLLMVGSVTLRPRQVPVAPVDIEGLGLLLESLVDVLDLNHLE
jgi:hypothetical protein